MFLVRSLVSVLGLGPFDLSVFMYRYWSGIVLRILVCYYKEVYANPLI